MPPSLSGDDSPAPVGSAITTPVNDDTSAVVPRKRGRPQITPLEPYKDIIVRLFTEGTSSTARSQLVLGIPLLTVIEDDVPIIDIARKLNLEHGLDISERTISRRLTSWNIPRKKQRTPASQELRNRILFHYNANLNDEQICKALETEGFEIKVKHLSRLRQKLGMRRRSRFPEFREYSDGEDDLEPKPKPSPQKKKKKSMPGNAGLIPKVTAFAEQYMSNFDGSHDFNHVRRVVGLAHQIYNETRQEKQENLIFADAGSQLDLQVVTLAALLHDVGDRKYLEPGQDSNTLVLATLLGFGAAEDLAIKVQRVVLGISYSSEIKDPAQVQALIAKYPELAIVQDADRLDAIGAVGIGRTFTFGGAKTQRSMGDSMQHFEEKLERIEGMMKTKAGKRMAKERTERLKIFKGWWAEEQKEAEGLLRRK